MAMGTLTPLPRFQRDPSMRRVGLGKEGNESRDLAEEKGPSAVT